MKLSTFEMDKEKENQGVWVELEGLKLLIARFGNEGCEKFALEHELIGKQFSKGSARALISSASKAGDKQKDLIIKAISQHVLLDWENLQDDDGKDIPFSEGKAHEILTKYPEFLSLVLEYALDVERFRKNKEEELVKN